MRAGDFQISDHQAAAQLACHTPGLAVVAQRLDHAIGLRRGQCCSRQLVEGLQRDEDTSALK